MIVTSQINPTTQTRRVEIIVTNKPKPVTQPQRGDITSYSIKETQIHTPP